MASMALGGSAAAAAPRVTCGSTVTTNVTLTADLRCPHGNGITLGSNVILDLGGHKLIGGGYAGVGVQTSPDSLGGNTIRNGTIKNWATGLLLQAQDGKPYTVSRVALRTAPVQHYYGNTTLNLTKVTAVDSRIEGQEGSDLAISHSRLTRSPVNVFFASATITGSTLVQSTLDTSARGEIVVDSSYLNGKGTSALGAVSETRLTIRNSVVRNYAEPVTGFWGAVTFTNSRFSDMPNGVLGDISYNIPDFDATSDIVGNRFIRSGVALRGDVPMIVENNTFTQNEIGVDFTRTPFPGEPPLTAEGSRAVGNVLTKNTGTGIQTDLSGLAVGSNTAQRNGGYGIYAPGAIDLGGNVAFRNTLGQCVGVVCTTR